MGYILDPWAKVYQKIFSRGSIYLTGSLGVLSWLSVEFVFKIEVLKHFRCKSNLIFNTFKNTFGTWAECLPLLPLAKTLKRVPSVYHFLG